MQGSVIKTIPIPDDVRLMTPLIIPVETQVREFDAKLLLSCVAAEAGFSVYLGSQTQIHKAITALPRSVYLSKDVRTSKERMFSIMKQLGHRIIAWDEEGLVRYPSYHYFKTRTSSDAIREIDAFFAWGDDDAEVMKTHADFGSIPIYKTGNPRVDLLRPELQVFHQAEAESLRQTYGPFILINTNFGHSNHFLSKYTIATPDGETNEKVLEENWDDDVARYRNAMYDAFLEMIPELGKAFPDTTIILRPHPSESHASWQQAAEGCPNIKVIHEGPVVPWLMAADVLVHNGCTTAVENFLLGKPSVTYRPMTSERFDRHLPDSLSFEARTMDDLVKEVGAFVGKTSAKAHTDAQQAKLDHHLLPLGGRLASDIIVDILHDLDICQSQLPAPSALAHVKGWSRAKARSLQKTLNSFVPGSKNSVLYEKHRFPGLSEDEVQRGIARFGKQMERFKNISAKQVSEGIFHISQTN